MRGEIERARAAAEAEVAAARGQTEGQIAAARQAADADIARLRGEADAAVGQAHAELKQVRAAVSAQVAAMREQTDSEVAAARQAADVEVARARAEADGARLNDAAQVSSAQLLSIPIPPPGLRAHTRAIEDSLGAVRTISFVLEAMAAGDAGAWNRADVDLLGRLIAMVRSQAGNLSQELRDLPSRYTDQDKAEAAADYSKAAAKAYGGVLQRITAVTEKLGQSEKRDGAAVVSLVSAMLDEHPWRRR